MKDYLSILVEDPQNYGMNIKDFRILLIEKFNNEITNNLFLESCIKKKNLIKEIQL